MQDRYRQLDEALLRRTAGPYISDKSSSIARLDDLPAGGGTARLIDAWRLGDLNGKPEGLAFTAQGRAIVGLDTRKPRRNLVLLEPPVAQLRSRGQSLN